MRAMSQIDFGGVLESGHHEEERSKRLGIHYPMWVMPLQRVLALAELSSHQVLKCTGQVVEFVVGAMVAIFVSHQWVALAHPDPDMRQFRVLQAALRNIVSGCIKVEGDYVYQSFYKWLRMTEAQVQDFRVAHVWYDWLSCPYVARSEGRGMSPELQAAVDSIVAYVQLSNYFMVLAPSVAHSELPATECSFESWRMRAWCRLELFAWVLADSKPPVISVRGTDLVHFITALTWLDDPPGAGLVTAEDDRSRILQLTEMMLQQKLQVLRSRAYRSREDLHDWRFFQAMRGRILQGLQQRFEHDHLNKFLRDFQFSSPTEVCQQGAGDGWTPLHYAAIAGGGVLPALVQAGCDPNGQVRRAYAQGGIMVGSRPLLMSASLGTEASTRLLLELRADPCLVNSQGLNALVGVVRNREPSVQLIVDLVRARVDVNSTSKWPTSFTPLHVAVARSSTEAVSTLLELRADMSRICFTGNALTSACLWNKVATVELLLTARMDPNFQWNTRWSGGWLPCVVARAASRMGAGSDLTALLALSDGGTPLMYAARGGNAKVVRLLLAARADAGMCNSAGQTAAAVATLHGHSAISALLDEARFASSGSAATAPRQRRLCATCCPATGEEAGDASMEELSALREKLLGDPCDAHIRTALV